MQADLEATREYELTLRSSFQEMARLRREVAGFIGASLQRGMFMVCLHEMVINAMEHGNGLDPQKTVTVKLVDAPFFLQAAPEDQGEGFDWRAKAGGLLELESGSERGRGIIIARACCEALDYNDKGNRVTLTVRKDKEETMP